MPSTAIGLMRGFDDQLTDVDDAFLRIVGYTRAEFERGAMSWREMTPPEFLPLDDAGIQQALRADSGGFTLPYRKEFFRKDGSRVPVLLCCAFVPDAPPGTWMGYVVDLSTPSAQHAEPQDATVSFRRVEPNAFYLRLMGELVRERTRLHAIFDSTSSMMWSVDASLRLTNANAAFQARVQQSVGRTIAVGETVLPSEYPLAVRAEWEGWYRQVLDGTPLVTQTRYHLGGSEACYAHVLTPYRDAHGAVIGVAGVSHDITALVRAEQRASQREADLIEAQRMARVGSWDWDTVNDTVVWSDGLCELLDWPRDSPVPSFADQAGFFAEESWQRLNAAIAQVMRAGVPYELELEMRTPGPVPWVMARGEPRYDSDGRMTGIHGVVMDITERRAAEETRRRLESQLLQSQKMQALGQLAGGVAHDFNNILTSILLQLGTMREEVAHLESVVASVEEVDRAARRASALTQQLLMFSRRQAPDLRPLEVNAVVHDFVRMLQRLIGEPYALQVEAHPAPLPVMGDRGMLEQVMMNLALNARDAMRPGGEVVIRTACGVIEPSDVPSWPGAVAGPYVEISVADQGCGIAPELHARLFEPFFTTKGAGSGTGLGLATSYGIVSQHGGWIEFDSRVGEGTTFRVRLPQRVTGSESAHVTGADPARAELARRRTPGRRARVLLVEDEPPLRTLVERTLVQHGYDVVTAADVPHALRSWQEAMHASQPFDMVLSDVVLQGERTGIDLVRALRETRPDLRCLYMTGYTDEMGKPGFAERAGGPVLRKPFDIPTLLEQVAGVLASTASTA